MSYTPPVTPTSEQEAALVEAFHVVFDIKDVAPPRDYSDHEHYQVRDEAFATLMAFNRLFSALGMESIHRSDGEGRPVAEEATS